jgi:hypothetical protein
MMAENKTVANNDNVSDFIGTLPAAQQKDSQQLIAMMSAETDQPAVMWGSSIIGFGTHHYRYESGREGDEPELAFSPRKGKLALYITHDSDQYTEQLDKLGKHKTGKSCIYIATLNDVDHTQLKQLIHTAHHDNKAVHN